MYNERDFQIENGVLIRYLGQNEHVVVPNGVISIGKLAFWQKKKTIRSIVIPNGVTSIGFRAFYSCWHLVELTVPDSIQEIGWEAFGNCISLKYINGRETDGWIIFQGKLINYLGKDEEVVVPESVTSIGTNAFWTASTQSLKRIVLTSHNIQFDDKAFNATPRLKEVLVPGNLNLLDLNCPKKLPVYNSLLSAIADYEDDEWD